MFSLTRWSSPIHTGFLVSRATQVPESLYARISSRGLSPAMARLSRRFDYACTRIRSPVLQPHLLRRHSDGLGSSAFARHYLRYHFCFLFLRVVRCFSSPGSPPDYCQDTAPSCGGLPHSDIRGSGDICSSPRLFAAYHVLLRLR